MSKQKVYIAGPMRGIPEYNFPAFLEAAKFLRGMGYHVFCPAELDTIFELDTHTDRTIEEQEDASIPEITRRFVRRDVHILCNELAAEHGDFLVTLEGWPASTGASGEVALARWLHLPVYAFKGILELGLVPVGPNG
jgi:hypothetical protein